MGYLIKTAAYIPILIGITAFFCSCNKKAPVVNTVNNLLYHIEGAKIVKSNVPVQVIGANAFHVFGAGGSDMNAWNMDIAREFIGNIKETPIAGNTIQDANGAFLYSLQAVADSNRKNNRITIFGAFGWDGTGASLFTGTRPGASPWYAAFKTKLQQWAVQFKDQPDVWLEVWNEPYRYDGADGYTDDIWMQDMNELLSVVRNTGNNNIVLIPCAAQGQDESVLINKGTAFLNGKVNVLFDVHAYEKWLLNNDFGKRLNALHQLQLPVIIGETAPMNAGVLMNPQSFLDSAYQSGFSICAWTWKWDETDQDALLDKNGLPNNNNNNNWGSVYKNLAGRQRIP